MFFLAIYVCVADGNIQPQKPKKSLLAGNKFSLTISVTKNVIIGGLIVHAWEYATRRNVGKKVNLQKWKKITINKIAFSK